MSQIVNQGSLATYGKENRNPNNGVAATVCRDALRNWCRTASTSLTWPTNCCRHLSALYQPARPAAAAAPPEVVTSIGSQNGAELPNLVAPDSNQPANVEPQGLDVSTPLLPAPSPSGLQYGSDLRSEVRSGMHDVLIPLPLVPNSNPVKNGCCLKLDLYEKQNLRYYVYAKIPLFSPLSEKIYKLEVTFSVDTVYFTGDEIDEVSKLLAERYASNRSDRSILDLKKKFEEAQNKMATSPPLNHDPAEYGSLLVIDFKTASILRDNLLPNITVGSSLWEKIGEIEVHGDETGRLILNELERAELLKILTPDTTCNGQGPEELLALKKHLLLALSQPLELLAKAPPSIAIPSTQNGDISSSKSGPKEPSNRQKLRSAAFS